MRDGAGDQYDHRTYAEKQLEIEQIKNKQLEKEIEHLQYEYEKLRKKFELLKEGRR